MEERLSTVLQESGGHEGIYRSLSWCFAAYSHLLGENSFSGQCKLPFDFLPDSFTGKEMYLLVSACCCMLLFAFVY